jgi:hypothetical protein
MMKGVVLKGHGMGEVNTIYLGGLFKKGGPRDWFKKLAVNFIKFSLDLVLKVVKLCLVLFYFGLQFSGVSGGHLESWVAWDREWVH